MSGSDQIAKQVAQDALEGVHAISLAGDTVRFDLAHDSGAFMNVGSGLSREIRGLPLVAGRPCDRRPQTSGRVSE